MQNNGNKGKVERKVIEVPLKLGDQHVKLNYPMGEEPELWSEFSPNLYKMHIKLELAGKVDTTSKVFGMRCFAVQGTNFTINGKKIFLRGRHDACVFP